VGLHADAVAQDGAAAVGRRGVDRDDADGLPFLPQVRGHPVDERRLAGAGRSRDADDERLPRVREEPREQRGGLGRAVLDQRDRARDRPHVALQYPLRESPLVQRHERPILPAARGSAGARNVSAAWSTQE
jgi:hypothetical protein